MDRIDSITDYRDAIGILGRWEHAYYVLGRPEVTDLEFDRLWDLVKAWETSHPDKVEPDSPTLRVGSDLSLDFPEVLHRIPMLSLDKAYTAGDIQAWVKRCATSLGHSFGICAEEKIDGLSVVLHYRDGVLEQALTRGNGVVGNDITPNARTIKDIPLRLTRPVSGVFRGEVYLGIQDFATLNARLDEPYANPRNLAGGTLRRVKSSEVAHVPLRMFVYEGFYAPSPNLHHLLLDDLSSLGFTCNPRRAYFSIPDQSEALTDWLDRETAERKGLPYEIDGLVLKVDDLASREELGYTGHHPRWALAWKFESPQGITRLLAIDIQVGRTGRITPVGRVEAVQVGGATIQNVTLHNQDYIATLELGVGDQVAVSRRGDVIPAVERVVEKADPPAPLWIMPSACPSCGSALVQDGAHHFCRNFDCPDRARGRLAFFTARGQMDIEGLGPETIEVLIAQGLVADIPDLYTFDPWKLSGVPGFGEKKILALQRGLEASKSRSYLQVLPSLGLPDIGPKVCELLVEAGYTAVRQLWDLVDSGRTGDLLSIHGMGDKTLARIQEEFGDPRVRALITALESAGLSFVHQEGEGASSGLDPIFAGQTWCVTGSFATFKPRDLAMDEVKQRGGKVVGDVSGACTHLLAGEKAGSKLDKALRLGIQVLNEDAFLALLGRTSSQAMPD